MGWYQWVEYQSGFRTKKKGIAVEKDNGYYLFYEVGKNNPITVKEHTLKILPIEIGLEEIRVLIDLAIDTKDREWFNELTEKLNQLSKHKIIHIQ